LYGFQGAPRRRRRPPGLGARRSRYNLQYCVTVLKSHRERPVTQSTPSIEAATIRGATVTTEDGGRLNAFATEPRMEVVSTESGWGFHERAEKLNGRMAMLGFIALLATEFALGGESFTRGLLGIG
jgi:hypothetical protein